MAARGARALLPCALLLCALAAARHDDDFAFDTGEEYRAEISNNSIATNGLRRLWGIPDTTAYVGRLFRMEIPKEAFSSDVAAYKIRSAEGRRTPSWLVVDSRHGLLSGVPLAHDLGPHTLLVTAHSHTQAATDTFTIEVKKRSERGHSRCGAAESRLFLQLLLEARLQRLSGERRARALMQLSNFMALSGEEFLMESFKPSGGETKQTVLQSGPGSTERRGSQTPTTAIYLDVGCGGKMWSRHKVLVAGVREQARDGTLSHVLQLPVIGWRLLMEKPKPVATRPRRQLDDFGSGGYDDYDDDDGDYSGDDDDYSFGAPDDIPNKPLQIIPTDKDTAETSQNVFNASVPRVLRPLSNYPTPETPVNIVPVPPTTTSEKMEFPTEKTSTMIEGKTTETVDDLNLTPPTLPPLVIPPATSPASNQLPHLNQQLKKLAVTAGKAFRYLIPSDLFIDNEDGTNLTYSIYEAENTPLKSNFWVQFLPDKKEVYGLPLEEHVSRWDLSVEAADSAGASARAPLVIVVQHHKSQRTLNHKFTITFKVQHKYRYAIDWQIRVLEGLVNLFRNKDMEHIIVRGVTTDQDLVKFSWSNDTLAKDVCPNADIEWIMSILESEMEKGSPSASLIREMQPQLKVSSVSWEGVGACAAAPAPPPAPPSLDTFPPVPRNRVDLVRATAGHLLVFKVPPDTFYDPEDGGTRNLKLSVIRGDRSPLPSAHWMQFDHNNQEFYGLPTDRDVGKKDYQLIAEDSTGKTANEVLIVEVSPAPSIQPPVEFVMTMNYPYPALASTALAKRAFLESLARLFGDDDASAIRLKSITDNPTTVIWYNTSLPMDHCPNELIEELERVIIKTDEANSLTDVVDAVMDNYEVMSIRVVPRGACSQIAAVPKIRPSGGSGLSESGPKSDPSAHREYWNYIVTFIIPAVVVVCMILIAAIIACALYRRRKTSKMSVGDEEERQAFRSRGIPVIFQDELDDKPEPGNKSPVIMKEEKPPLLPPPDYRADADSPTPSRAPYRPPPPFTASRAASRPKATPTYRKPPPYVPP